jgi:hypothetical protein
MTPDAITLLFKEARDTFPPIEGKPTNDNLQSMHEKLLPILMEISYDQLGGTHSLVGILTDATRYAANHGGATFVHPLHLPLYDTTIADNTTTVVCVHAESAHQAKLDDYASFKAAECGAAKFLRKVVDEVWYNGLKDADTFYTKVTARKIIAFLNANSGGLHAIDMISLCTNMHNYYTQADGIPQYINMLEGAQKKEMRAGMPNADVKLVMMASAAVLAAQHFPCKVNDWEGLPSASPTWTAWKTAFCLVHMKRQQQILALGGGASRRGSRCDPGGGAGNRASQNCTQQPGSCSNEQYRGPPAAHCCQLGPHGHHHVAHSNQQKNWLMRRLVGAVLRRRLRVGAGLRRRLRQQFQQVFVR